MAATVERIVGLRVCVDDSSAKSVSTERLIAQLAEMLGARPGDRIYKRIDHLVVPVVADARAPRVVRACVVVLGENADKAIRIIRFDDGSEIEFYGTTGPRVTWKWNLCQ